MYALVIVRVPGFVAYPTIAMFGWWFLLISGIGVVVAVMTSRADLTLLVAAIAAQAAVLYVVATMDGAARPYMALKWRS